MTLYDGFCTALNDARDVAANGYLQLLASFVKDIEDASSSDAILADYCLKMANVIQRKDFALDGELTSRFAQLFGEAHFAHICRGRGVPLTKIKEQKGLETPDFLRQLSQQNIYFEVKTPSVVNGGHGIGNDLSRSLDAQIDIEQQLRAGKQVAIGTSVIQPYGERPYRLGAISAVIMTLIDKIRQNLKSGQFSNPNTFLVLNLCLIPPTITDNRVLRPAYCDDYMFPKPVTGDLWMVAFAQPGMLVHGCPEFEGKPCIEGVIQECGVLVRNECANIAGLLVVVYPLGGKPRIYGLYRRNDHGRWTDEDDGVICILDKLTCHAWNDDDDSNGWCLTGREPIGCRTVLG